MVDDKSVILTCTQLPDACNVVYTKVSQGVTHAWYHFDESFNSTFCIAFNEDKGRWEIRDFCKQPPRVVAYNNSAAVELKQTRGRWMIPRRGAVSISFTWNSAKGGKKRRFEEANARGNKRAKRDFGDTVNQELVPIAPKHKPSKQIKSRILPDSPQPLQCDIDTVNDELYVGFYVEDIMEHYFNVEDQYLPTPDYISKKQTNMKPSNREKMLDWLLFVATKFEQTDASFHLAVNIFDRYMSSKKIDKSRLQLVGSVCLWLAAKYCEIRVAEMHDFILVTENLFNETDMLEVESDIVNTLDFNFTVPTSLSFAQRFCHVVKYLLQTEKQQKRLAHLVNYYLEHCLLIYELVGILPSKIAAAATYAGAFWLDKDFLWDDDMKRVTGYDVEEFIDIVDIIKSEVYEKRKESINQVTKKYQDKSREYVALMKYTGA